MNIFVLDKNTTKCAQAHMDRHVVKMPLESAQMLCTSLNYYKVETPYKPVHRNHPCTLWTKTNRSNFLWLCELGLELCEEYTFRYGKTHKCLEVIEYCITNANSIPDGNLTKFALAMPDEYKRCDPIESYRNYYNGGKTHLAEWKLREKPEWFVGS